MSLEHEQQQIFSPKNGLPKHYCRMIQRMKMGNSKQHCAICQDGFIQSNHPQYQTKPSNASPANTSSTMIAPNSG